MKKILPILIILNSISASAQYGGEIPPPLINCSDCIVKCVLNINELKSVNIATLNSKTYFKVAGYYDENDGGGGYFLWDPTSNIAPDNGYVLESFASTTSIGRYLRIKKGVVRLKEFGAIKNSINNPTNRTATNAFGDAISYFKNTNNIAIPLREKLTAIDIYFDPGEYEISYSYTDNLKLKLSGESGTIIKPKEGSNFILEFGLNGASRIMEHEITGITFAGRNYYQLAPSFPPHPTGNEITYPWAIQFNYTHYTDINGVELRIDKCSFITINGCNLKNNWQTYISNSSFLHCAKAIQIRDASETRIFNCNFNKCGYGIDAGGENSYINGISTPNHQGLYVKNSFLMDCKNYPIYCSYMDYVDLSNNMIDYNNKPVLLKSITTGNLTANYLGTRINDDNKNSEVDSKSLVITSGKTDGFQSNSEDRSTNVRVTNNYIVSRPNDNIYPVSAVLVINSSSLLFSNNHIDYFNGSGLTLKYTIDTKINSNFFNANLAPNFFNPNSKGLVSTDISGSGRNLALNNFGVNKDGVDGINTKVITDDNFSDDAILQNGNNYTADVVIGNKNDNKSVNIFNGATASLSMNKDYVYSTRDFRIGANKYLQYLFPNPSDGLSSVFGLDPTNTDYLAIGGIFGANKPSAINFKLKGVDKFRIGDEYNLSLKDFRLNQNKFLQLLYPDNNNNSNSLLASVLGGDDKNIYLGNIFGQLPNNGSLIFRGNNGFDKLKISEGVLKNVQNNWYNVSVDNFFTSFDYSTPITAIINVNFDEFNSAKILLTRVNSELFFNPSILKKSKYTIVLQQDNTGSRNLSFPSNTFIKGTISLTPNSYSVLNIDFDGTNTFINITTGWFKIP